MTPVVAVQQTEQHSARWILELCQKYDLTRFDVVVYGIVLANEQTTPAPTIDELAEIASVKRRFMLRTLRKLQLVGLLLRRATLGRGARTRYVVTGPR